LTHVVVVWQIAHCVEHCDVACAGAAGNVVVPVASNSPA
jgi:hypothetical protein